MTTQSRRRFPPSRTATVLALFLAALPAILGPAVLRAQSVEFSPLLAAEEFRAFFARGDTLYGGLAVGGVALWDGDDPADYVRWTSLDGLTSNRIVDFAHSGRYLWIATADAGLTRVDDAVSPVEFRGFTDLGGLEMTCVAGTVLADGTELVFYGRGAGGVGRINDGFPGQIYTAFDSDLVDDRVKDLAFFRDELWVATLGGVSLFTDNVFEDRSAGLPGGAARGLCAVADTLLLAATNGGVARWDDDASAWVRLGTLTDWVDHVIVDGGALWAVTTGGDVDAKLWRYEGTDWTAVPVPLENARDLAVHGGALWIGGRYEDATMAATNFQSAGSWVARRDGAVWSTHVLDELLPQGIQGVGFGPDGTPWLGAVLGDALSHRTDDGWQQIYELATTENDSLGLFNHDGGILAVAPLPDGEVWFSQFKAGVGRYVPAHDGEPARIEHLTTENSGLTSDRVDRIFVHPDGPLIFMNDRTGADLLAVPSAWRDPDMWRPVFADSLGYTRPRDAVAARADRIWFAVPDVGLVCWDPNGYAHGPGEDLTWLDPDDDYFFPVVERVSGSVVDMTGVLGIAVADDGTLWAGGGGVTHFSYDYDTGGRHHLGSWSQKTDVSVEGLLTGSVKDIALDRNGDVWAATDAGLNRIRTGIGGTTIDGYTDVKNFIDYGLDFYFTSANVVVGLPGGAVRRVTADADGGRILAGADGGAVIVTVGRAPSGGAAALDGLYLYPNPFQPGSGQELKLGGIVADVTLEDLLPTGGAAVQILTIEGEPVYSNEHVEADAGFWDGRNILGNLVSTGYYVVRVSLGGVVTVKTLAVVR